MCAGTLSVGAANSTAPIASNPCEKPGLKKLSSDKTQTYYRRKIAAEDDASFRAKIQEALDDPSPLIPHAEVEAHFAKRRSEALAKVKKFSVEPSRSWRQIRDYGGIENYLRLRVEEREKRTGKKLTPEDLP